MTAMLGRGEVTSVLLCNASASRRVMSKTNTSIQTKQFAFLPKKLLHVIQIRLALAAENSNLSQKRDEVVET